MDCSLSGSSVHGTLQARILEWVPVPFSKGSQPKDRTQASGIASYFLSHQGSPRILEWEAYPFSRGICPTQESNQGLLHCRRILYQLSYQGSPCYLFKSLQMPKPYHPSISFPKSGDHFVFSPIARDVTLSLAARQNHLGSFFKLLKPGITPDQLNLNLRNWNPDYVLFLSFPENSRTLNEDLARFFFFPVLSRHQLFGST